MSCPKTGGDHWWRKWAEDGTTPLSHWICQLCDKRRRSKYNYELLPDGTWHFWGRCVPALTTAEMTKRRL